MDKGTAYEGFATLYDGTGNSSATVFQQIMTKCVVDYELVRLVQQHGDKPHRATPLGRFPELWPFDLLKRLLIEHAQRFQEQIGSVGYDALTDIYAFKVWGPYTEKVDSRSTPLYFTPEADNPFYGGEKPQAVTVYGYRGDEYNVEKGCAFLIQGEFTRSATKGYVDEQSGKVLV